MDMPWKQIAGLRDIVTHKYRTIDLEIVWNTVIQNIPLLYEFLKSILNTND